MIMIFFIHFTFKENQGEDDLSKGKFVVLNGMGEKGWTSTHR